MTQQDIENIATAFQTIATAIPNLANSPIVNISQQLDQITQQLNQLTQNVQQNTRYIVDLPRQINRTLYVLEQRMQARQINSTIRDPRTPIEALRTNAETIPDNFPENYNAIETATPDVIDGLLNAYNQTTDGSIRDRTKASCQVFGHNFSLDRNSRQSYSSLRTDVVPYLSKH